jgi:hypothetical protein
MAIVHRVDILGNNFVDNDISATYYHKGPIAWKRDVEDILGQRIHVEMKTANGTSIRKLPDLKDCCDDVLNNRPLSQRRKKSVNPETYQRTPCPRTTSAGNTTEKLKHKAKTSMTGSKGLVHTERVSEETIAWETLYNIDVTKPFDMATTSHQLSLLTTDLDNMKNKIRHHVTRKCRLTRRYNDTHVNRQRKQLDTKTSATETTMTLNQYTELMKLEREQVSMAKISVASIELLLKQLGRRWLDNVNITTQ